MAGVGCLVARLRSQCQRLACRPQRTSRGKGTSSSSSKVGKSAVVTMSGTSEAVPATAAVEEATRGLRAAKVSDLDGSAPDSTDFANYFCAYGYIYHQVWGIVFSSLRV